MDFRWRSQVLPRGGLESDEKLMSQKFIPEREALLMNIATYVLV